MISSLASFACSVASRARSLHRSAVESHGVRRVRRRQERRRRATIVATCCIVRCADLVDGVEIGVVVAIGEVPVEERRHAGAS